MATHFKFSFRFSRVAYLFDAKPHLGMHIYRILFFWLWLYTSTAQTPAYLRYGVMDGLPGNLVYCGLQDSRGFLWFGTDKGLARFDGSRFRTYSMLDGLPDLEVLGMKEDTKGRIWLFCFRRKPCYLYEGRIYTEKQDSLLAKVDFAGGTYNISEDSSGGIWHFEPSYKAYRIRNNKITPYWFPKGTAALQKVGSDYLVIGTHSVMKFTADQRVEIIYQIEPNYGLPSIGVSKNRILYSYTDKLLLLEWKNGRINKLMELHHPSGQIYTDRRGRFWVCSPALGAVCFDNARQDLTNAVTYLPGKKITAMFEDGQGTYWFCTNDEGVLALPKNTPVTYRKGILPSNNIRTLSGNAAGHILAGDDVGNVLVIRGGAIQTIPFGAVDGYNLIRQIIPVGNDGFCAVSDESLLFCRDNYLHTLRRDIPYGLKSVAIQDDKIWVASASRLGYVRQENDLPYTDVIKARFTSVSMDDAHNVWAGGMNGLYSQADSFQFNWGDRFPELKSRIATISRADSNRIWIVTPEFGLLSVAVKSGTVVGLEAVNKRLKQPIHNTQSFYTEPDGTIWLATNRGVYGLKQDGRTTHFNRYDGLADDDVNSVLVQNDTLWVGTVAGLTRIVLREPYERGNFGTYITALRFQKDNQPHLLHLLDSFTVNREITLSPDAVNPELEVAGLDFRSRGNLSFEIVQTDLLLPLRWWTLDNVSSWISGSFKNKKKSVKVGSPMYALGAYLPPGRYQFRVTAIKASGIRSQFPDTWTLVKLPYWYETLWFYLFIWSIVAYVVWHIYQVRSDYRKALVAASTLQLQALQAQINPHFIGNAINAIQQFLYPPNPVKASEYISLFMHLLRRTMLFSEKTFITFKVELDYCHEYLELSRLRFEHHFQFEINGAAGIPADTPVPSMLIQPVLENATIHGLAPKGTSVIRLDFSCENGQLRCVLTDNGIGFKKAQKQKQRAGIQHESKGLEMLQKKISTLNRLYDLELEFAMEDLSECQPPEEGTRVTIAYNIVKAWKGVNTPLPPPHA